MLIIKQAQLLEFKQVSSDELINHLTKYLLTFLDQTLEVKYNLFLEQVKQIIQKGLQLGIESEKDIAQ